MGMLPTGEWQIGKVYFSVCALTKILRIISGPLTCYGLPRERCRGGILIK